MYSVVGTGTGVAMDTGTVVGAGVKTGVRDGVTCVAAGVLVPELVVQPEESTHSSIARAGIRIFISFMSSSLILLPISDLWMCFCRINGDEVILAHKRNRWYAVSKEAVSKCRSGLPEQISGHSDIFCMRNPFSKPAFEHHNIRVPEIPFQDEKN